MWNEPNAFKKWRLADLFRQILKVKEVQSHRQNRGPRDFLKNSHGEIYMGLPLIPRMGEKQQTGGVDALRFPDSHEYGRTVFNLYTPYD